MSDVGPVERLTLAKRAEWARHALEEACKNLYQSRQRERAYVEAVCGRYRELQSLRAAIEMDR